MPFWLEVSVSALLLIGGTFVLIGSIGLARLQDFYMRLHAPTKATTLGIGTLLLASMLLVSYQQEMISVHELIISLFLSITAPVSAHMMAKAALHHKVAIQPRTQNPQLSERAYTHQPPEDPETTEQQQP